MATFNKKFTPKSTATAPATKVQRPSLALKMKEPDAEKSTVLCFVREMASKKNENNKFFIGEVAARDEDGNVIKNDKGWAEGSGSVFFFFPKGEGGDLMLKNEGDDKASLVCKMEKKENEKGALYRGKTEDGTQYYLDKPLPKKA